MIGNAYPTRRKTIRTAGVTILRNIAETRWFNSLPTPCRLWTSVVLGGILASFLLFQGVPSIYGQLTTSASLNGTVLDSSGAVVPGASVTLTSSERSFTRISTSESNGHYVFTLLPPGTYSLRVEKTAFKAYSQTGITLNLGQPATLDITLEVGAVSQQVEVTASAPLLNTTNPNIATDLTSTQVVELPLNWRNVFTLVTLDSSTSNMAQYQSVSSGSGMASVSDQDAGEFNFGGQRMGWTAFLLDGHWARTRLAKPP